MACISQLNSVISPDEPIQPIPETGLVPQSGSLSSEPNHSLQEFYQLQQFLLLGTLVFIGIIFISVWLVYSLSVALNYLLGACTGVIYLRMMAKDVERLGTENQHLSKARLALFVGLIIASTQLKQLQILPIFLGFLTYKVTVLAYLLRTVITPTSRSGM